MMRKQTVLANILLIGFILGIHEGRIALWKDDHADIAAVRLHLCPGGPRLCVFGVGRV